MTSKYLAIIPARKGSKRLPGKNLKNFHGLPLIQWTINAALESKYIAKIIVSTDDPEIWSLCESTGVEYLIRDENLSNDTASSSSVVMDVLEKLRDSIFSNVVLLQPTSPLRKSKHLDKAISLFEKYNIKSLVSVRKADQYDSIEDGYLDKDFFCDLNLNEESKFRFLNGAIYILNINKFIDDNLFVDSETAAFFMSNETSVDIDTQQDFENAEKYFER